MIGSILITGGTGYFGQALSRRLLEQNLSDRICVYSRDEWKQAQMRKALNEDPRCRWFVGDVRDQDRLRRALSGVDVVIHAAALKRIEVGHYNPDEMVKTNVQGTMNVVHGATDAGVGRVVLLSSDKAYHPVSAYGQSKAMAESLVLAANNTVGQRGPRFAVVRYGNVAGSTGSVIPTWRSLLAGGAREVPVTDLECTRFWMTIGEAVDLVLNVIMGENVPADQPVIPELPAYRLGDLCFAMGADAKIVGLGAWEKMHESMRDGLCSETARRMSVAEIKEALTHV